jgi:hypothetical protein
MNTLKNSKCLVEYNPERKEIFARNLTDTYNDPAMYSKTKRGIKGAWIDLEAAFNENTTMHDVAGLLAARNIRTHSWCMVD